MKRRSISATMPSTVRACRKVCKQAEKRVDRRGFQARLPSYSRCDMRPRPAHFTAIFKLCDMCGRPLRCKRNLRERCGTWSGADMCAAFDAAHTPQAQMGVRRSGPIQAHALEALVAKLVFLIRSLDRCAMPLL